MRLIITLPTEDKGAVVYAWLVDLRTHAHTRTWIYSPRLKLTTQRIDTFLPSFRHDFFQFFQSEAGKHPGNYLRFVRAELQ